MMSSAKKRATSPAQEGSPDTQAARTSQVRNDGTVTRPGTAGAARGPTPTPSLTNKRPPTGRRRGRKNREVVEVVEAPPETPPDPFQGAIQQFDNADGLAGGAVMLVTKEKDAFDDDFGSEMLDSADAVTINDVSRMNPHYLHTFLVSGVAIFFIVLFGVFVHEFSEPLRETRTENKELSLQVSIMTDALLSEYQAATALIATTEYYLARNQGSSQTYMEQTTALIAAFRATIETTDARVTYASLIFEKIESKLVTPLSGLRVKDGINIALLNQARDGVLKGAPAASIFTQYDIILRNMMMFEGRLLGVRMFYDDSDRDAISKLSTLREMQNYELSALYSQWVNQSSSSSELRAFNTFDELAMPWSMASVMDVDEALRLALSDDVFGADRTYGFLRDLAYKMNALIVPTATSELYRQLGEQSYVGQGVNWDPVYANSLLANFLPTNLQQLQQHNAVLVWILDRPVPARRIAHFTCLVLLFCIAVVALISHIINAIQYGRNREEHETANREIRLLQRSLTRMTNFVAKAAHLDIQAVGSIIRRAQRAKTVVPPEEQQLYNSLSALRDVELFMPSTVLRPPQEINKLALNKAQLFLQPALGYSQSTVALRLNLSVFHSQFFSAGVKQKALQHQMTRCLTALQDLADEHVSSHGSILNVQGDHAILWLNLLRPTNYPNMCAISIALALTEECERLSIRPPAMSIAAGDALAGHVSSIAPDNPTNVSASVMCFTAFGNVTKDFGILETVAKVHEAPLCINNAASLGFFQERIEFDGESFHATHTSTLARLTTVSSHNSEGEYNQEHEEADDKTKSMNRGGRERLTLEERLRKLHCHFWPLEMVNPAATRSSDDVLGKMEQNFQATRARQAALRQQRHVVPLGMDAGDASVANTTDAIVLEDGATFRDYSRDLPDGSLIFPCFVLVPFEVSKPEENAAVAAWEAFFAAYVDCCRGATAERVSHALLQLSEYTNKHPHASTQPTVDRLKKLLLLAKSTGEVSTSISNLKRTRLIETLCA